MDHTIGLCQWSNHEENGPDGKVHGANMAPTWDLSAPTGPHIGPMNLGGVLHHVTLELIDDIAFTK